ncbi:MAG: hypothetical protein L6Q78_08230 [Bacteroidia bacterium]|nr:hypothetical protein [Bacteroidia bacterium]
MRFFILLIVLGLVNTTFAQIPNGVSLNFSLGTQNSTLIRNFKGETATSQISQQTFEFSVGSSLFKKGTLMGLNLSYAGSLNESSSSSKSSANSIGFNMPLGRYFDLGKGFGYSFDIRPGYLYRVTQIDFSGFSSRISEHELSSYAGMGIWWMPVPKIGFELKYNLIAFRHAWTGSLEESAGFGNSQHEQNTSFVIYSPGNIQPGAFVLSAFYLIRK